MSFFASNFIFDGVNSERFNLSIFTPDGAESSVDIPDVDVITESIWKRPTRYLLGVAQNSVLEFDLNFVAPYELDAREAGLIKSWLFGHSTYKKLIIVQPDLQNVYYNCLLTQPKDYFVGNIHRGFSTVVLADSPWGWTLPKTKTYNYTSSIVNSTINFYNDTDNNDYTYPILEFTTNTYTTPTDITLSIKNASDNNREFLFTGLSNSEVMTIDCDLQTVRSSTGLYRLSNFNKKFFRLIKGMNVLTIANSRISQLKITTSLARKMI